MLYLFAMTGFCVCRNDSCCIYIHTIVHTSFISNTFYIVCITVTSFTHIHTKTDRYVLEDFDSKPTFASFLPGVAGLYGKPVWSFYVNRGQGVASFGFKSKDYPILEFNPANKAYQLTPYIGFRTFLKGSIESRILTVARSQFRCTMAPLHNFGSRISCGIRLQLYSHSHVLTWSTTHFTHGSLWIPRESHIRVVVHWPLVLVPTAIAAMDLILLMASGVREPASFP